MPAARKVFLLLILLTLLLPACQAGASPAQPLPTSSGPIVTFTRPARQAESLATPTPPPPVGDDAAPTRVVSPTAADTPVPTTIPTSTPDPILAQARLLGVSWQPGYNLLLSIDFPGPVKAEDVEVVIEDDEIYECQVLSQFPNRLYCIGRGRNVYDRMDVRIFPTGSVTPSYEGQIYVPYFTEKFTE